MNKIINMKKIVIEIEKLNDEQFGVYKAQPNAERLRVFVQRQYETHNSTSVTDVINVNGNYNYSNNMLSDEIMDMIESEVF